MELRNHPVMFSDGVNVWPPIWFRTYGQGSAFVYGELGVLDAVFLSQIVFHRVYLLVHTDEGNSYIGTLLFEKADSAKAVFDLLQTCINKTVTAIGVLDVPEQFLNTQKPRLVRSRSFPAQPKQDFPAPLLRDRR